MSEFKPINTQEELDAVIGDRLKRERATVEKQYEGFLSPEDAAKQYEGWLSPKETAKKYEGWLSPEEAAKKDAKIKGYETSSVKMRIAHEQGIPFELIDRLQGEDEKAIRRDAETLSAFLARSTPEAPLGSTEEPALSSKDAAFKSMAASLTNKGE